MSKELVIGSNRHETRVAVLEDDQLVEVYFQRANEYSLAGSIHKGRVTRVLPGMQSAFVDLGLERDTFLYVSDFFEEHEDIDTLGDDKPTRGERRDSRPARAGDAVPNGGAREPEAAAALAPESPASETDTAPDLNGTPLPPPNGPLNAAASSNRPPERVEDDRGFRGDRRGRRSRRRRPRGQGFPENKYAQPPGSQVKREQDADVSADKQPDDASDVILLPGESLAKYRERANTIPNAATTAEQTATVSDEDDFREGPEDELPEESEADLHEELQAELEELELSDKVFAHHEDPSPVAEEEKLEEVKQDQPASPQPESNGLEAPERQFEDIQTDAPLPSETIAASIESEEIPARDDSRVEASEVSEQHEFEEPASFSNEGRSEIEPAQSAGPVAPQTAVLREQGGRYMHRMPRRMRRRRGGERFSSPGQDLGGESARPAIVTPSRREPEGRTEARSDSPESRSFATDRAAPSISDLLKPGQEIIVQIAKEPLGQKGARITSHVALPGRYVVFMPSVTHAGVSRKIASDEERYRLKRILHKHRAGTTGGFIVRTAGEGIPEEEIAADMNFLYNQWMEIREKAEKKPAPALLHSDLGIVQRILRDRLTEDFKAIWVDNEEMYENVLSFMQRFQPPLVSRVKMYTRPAPIFDAFNITQEIEKALRPKVWLKSGGYIVINQTEALVAIDINTGKFVGKSNRLEDTIVKTNTEAVREIVRQIRLRDLGGIIVVDFIDMDERKNRQKVMQALEEAMRADRAPYKILQFNDFGLVAITRKRVKQSLERALCSPCPYCDGAGYIKSVHTVVSEILIEAQKLAKAIEGKDVVLRVNPAVAKVLKSSHNRYLEEIEDTLKRPVLVTSDATLHQEKFDLA